MVDAERELRICREAHGRCQAWRKHDFEKIRALEQAASGDWSVQRLRAENETLRAGNARLESDVRRLGSENHSLEAENDTLRAELAGVTAERDRLVQTVELTRRRCDQDGGGEMTLHNVRAVLDNEQSAKIVQNARLPRLPEDAIPIVQELLKLSFDRIAELERQVASLMRDRDVADRSGSHA